MTPDGRAVAVKTGPVSLSFTSEAAGLRWLGALAAEVIEVGEDRLVLEWIATTEPTKAVAERFGRELALMHVEGADSFGAPWPGFIAELPMDNSPSDDWPSFYVRQRVLPFTRMAGLSADEERLIRRCAEQPQEPPARIHGDLWSGNVLWQGDRCVLIDPAAHGGHRETDLAMLALFGVPYLDWILRAYDEVAPLADGWRERVRLHQLHPLAVHAVLFGEPYVSDLKRALSA